MILLGGMCIHVVLHGYLEEREGMYFLPREGEEVKVEDIYPVTIMRARYGGSYEGGKWLAFSCDPNFVPPEIWDGDIDCSQFFADFNEQSVKQARKNPLKIGRGDNPQEALKDLARQYHNG